MPMTSLPPARGHPGPSPSQAAPRRPALLLASAAIAIVALLLAGPASGWTKTESDVPYTAMDVADGATFNPLPPTENAKAIPLIDNHARAVLVANSIYCNTVVGAAPQTGLYESEWIPVGFEFEYYRQKATQVKVHNDMYIIVDTPGRAQEPCTSTNAANLDSTLAPNHVIAPFWYRMVPDTTTYWVEGTAPNRVFVLQFTGYMTEQYYDQWSPALTCSIYYTVTLPLYLSITYPLQVANGQTSNPGSQPAPPNPPGPPPACDTTRKNPPPYTMQVQIHEADDAIEFHYIDAVTDANLLPSSPVIGIEGCSGKRDLDVSANVPRGLGGLLTTNAFRFEAIPNDPPTAVADSYSTKEDKKLTVSSSSGLLVNDKDDYWCTSGPKASIVSGPTYASSGGFSLAADGSFTYDPVANFYGVDSFTYLITDEWGATSTAATVTITVTPQNDAPDFTPTSASIALTPGTTSTIDEWAKGIHEGGAFSVKGTDTCTASSTTDCRDARTVKTAAGTSTDAQQSIRFATTWTTTKNLAFQAGGEPAVVPSVFTPPDATNRYTDDPSGIRWGRLSAAFAPNTCGNATVDVKAWDNGGTTGTTSDDAESAAKQFTFVVDCSPTATDQSLSVDEDSTLVFTFLAADPDDATSSLTFRATGTLPAGFSYADGKATYKPPQDFCTRDGETVPVTFEVEDPEGHTDDGVVRITVRCVNDVPVARPDGFMVEKGSDGVLLDLLANDGDVDLPYDFIWLDSVTSPTTGGGTVSIADGKAWYVPEPDFVSPANDTFQYVVRDLAGATSTATVQVLVFDASTPPIARDMNIQTDEDSTLVWTLDYLDPMDPIDDLLVDVPAATAQLGSLDATALPVLRYVPPADVCGVTDMFEYTVTNTRGIQDSGVVRISLLCINDAPRPQDDVYEWIEDAPAGTLSVLANDWDDDPLRIRNVTQPWFGTVTFTADSLELMLHGNATGMGTFTYTLQDPAGLQGTATVTLRIAPVADLPVAQDDVFLVAEDHPGLVVDPLANDGDGDGPVRIVDFGQPAHGTLADAGGLLRFAPGADRTEAVTVPYTIKDSDGNTASAKITFQIQPVNDAPVAVPDPAGRSYVVPAPDVLQVDRASGVLANDKDVDGDILQAVLASPPSHGTLDLRPDGSFVFDAYPVRSGTLTFTYRARDPAGALSEPVTVTMEVLNAPSGAPVAGTLTHEARSPPAPRLTGPATARAGDEVTAVATALQGVVVWSDMAGLDLPWTQAPGGVLMFTAPEVPPGQERTVSFAARAQAGQLSLPAIYTLRVLPRNVAPEALLEVRESAQAGDVVVVDGSGSRDLEGSPLRYTWRIVAGDPVELQGTDGPAPSFTAPASGYTVLGLVVDDGEASSTEALARIDFRPAPAAWPQGFTFTTEGRLASFRVDDPAPGLRYTWSFGDGATASGASVEHLFATMGAHEVRLTVEDQAGAAQTHGAQVMLGRAGDPTVQEAASEDGARAPWWLLAATAGLAGLGAAAWLWRTRQR